MAVMRSHLERVRARVQPVAVQVSDSLVAAIGVLAPNLTASDALPADLTSDIPPASPEPEFRATLHAGLERAHRQQSAQRRLGTRPRPGGSRARRRARSWIWVLVLAALAGLAWLWWTHYRAAQPVVEQAAE